MRTGSGRAAGAAAGCSARCITLGRTVKIKTEAGEYTAFAARLDRDGQLICQSEEGEEIKVRAGEVSVRGLDGYL